MSSVRCPSCETRLPCQPFETSVRCATCAVDVVVPPWVSFLGAGDDDRWAWRQCRAGLRVVCWGAGLVAGIGSLFFLAHFLKATTREAEAVDVNLVGVAAALAWASAMIGAVLAHVIGQVICCGARVPNRSWAIWSMGLAGLTAVLLVVFLVAVVGVEMLRPDVAPMAFAVGLAACGSLGCWFRFLHDAAKRFGAHDLAVQCVGCGALQAVLFALMLVGVGVERPTFYVMVLGFVQVGLALWYFGLLAHITSAVTRTIDQVEELGR